jgi:phosphoglycolate phosphatase-like HAD superfamily hydrolase
VRPLALDLDGVLGDTRPLWNDWLTDLRRRVRVDVEDLPDDRAAAAAKLDRVAGNWRALLERFAEERAAIYLRPSADVSAALRRLHGAGVALGAFTDAPEPLARVALAQLSAARRLAAVETGAGALERLVRRLGPRTQEVRRRDDLLDVVSSLRG